MFLTPGTRPGRGRADQVIGAVANAVVVMTAAGFLATGVTINASNALSVPGGIVGNLPVTGLVSANRLSVSGAVNAASIFGTTGHRFATTPGTVTDTASSGTVTTVYGSNFGGDTLAASSSITITNAYGVFIADHTAGSNVTLTNKYALGVSGASDFNGIVNVAAAGFQCRTTTAIGIDLGYDVSNAISFFSTGGRVAAVGRGVNGARFASDQFISWASSADTRSSADLALYRAAANNHAWRNGTNPQKGDHYLTYTSGTSFERFSIDCGQTTANVIRLMAEKGGSGGSLRPIAIDGYSKSGAMANSDIPQGSWALFKDTGGGSVVLGYNDGGTLKTVALT